MTILSHPLFLSNQRGSGLFIILIAVALFGALSYAISRGGGGVRNLSQEKNRLIASEMIDTGNRFSEIVSIMKLHGIKEDKISFEYNADYVNAACLSDSCKVFAYDGGGLEWETPPTNSNGGEDWAFTGDMAVANVGTASADLIAILPNISQEVCHRINVVVGLYDETGTISIIAPMSLDQFTGTYKLAPVSLTSANLDGQKSGCFYTSSLSGTTIASSPLLTSYVFYQVLIAR